MHRSGGFDVLGKRVSVGVAGKRRHPCLGANRHAMLALVLRESVGVVLCERGLVHHMHLNRRLLLL